MVKKDKKDKDKDADEDLASFASKTTGLDKREKEKGKGKEKETQKQPAEKAKPKKKPPPAAKGESSYMGDIDLPPSESEGEEEEEGLEEEEGSKEGSVSKRHLAPVEELKIEKSNKEERKKQQREEMLAAQAEASRQEALREDDDTAFSVAVGAGSMGDAMKDANARDIKVLKMSVSARGKALLTNADLSIVAGRRYGLVGPNGMGKSTLLKLLARRQIPVPDYIDVLLVEQEVQAGEESAIQAVVTANKELAALREEEKKLAALSLEGHDKEDDHGARLGEIYERIEELGGSTAEARASKILSGLGFTDAMQKRPTQSFSGGWRMRISLARALFVQPTLLLLDEPTNHLDLNAVLWLEEYLLRWKKTLVVVSHDRDFLNTACTDIIHLFEQQLHYYRGNYNAFEEMFDQKKAMANKVYEKYEKQLKAAKAQGVSKADREKIKDRARTDKARKAGKKGAKGGADEGGPSEAPEADAIKKWRDYTVEFHFPDPTALTPPLLQLLEVGFSYPGREDFALKNINVGIDMGTRVAIVGPNGAGKSTLLNLLAGDLEPTAGEWRRSQKLRIGRYSQHFLDVLTMDENPVQYLLRLYPDAIDKPSRQESMRSKLGKFGLASHNHLSPICKLSGGQKARVVFTSISLSNPHILLLDEPTNHLDMQSIDALADAIEEFEGGVVLVSHDATLISRMCEDEERSEIWIVDEGTVKRHDGSFADYRNQLIKQLAMDDEA
eukprot:jgi/Mesvir1/29322/Mv01577-RA.1